jgi:hypothetical protein
VNNSNQRVKSGDFHFARANYSPLFQIKKGCGEQVVFFNFGKISFDREILAAQSLLMNFSQSKIGSLILFVFAVGIAYAAESKYQKIQISSANIQSTPIIVQSDVSGGVGHFTVTAGLRDRENTLRLGSLWVYDGPKYISDCLVAHGKIIDGGVRFTFDVATNYFASSNFNLMYDNTNGFPAIRY